MDGQHQYEINLKKDDLFICLSSDDVYFISKQMDKWFSILLDDSYVPVSAPQRQPLPQAAPESVSEPVPVAQQPVPQPMPEPVAMAEQQSQPQPMPLPQEVMPQPVAAPGAFISPSQAQMPQPAPVIPNAASNDQLAQQLMMQQQMAQQQAALAQQQAQMAQQIQPMPVMQAAAPQAQPTLQDVLDQVGQPNLPSFVSQQAAVQPAAMSAMPPAANYQDVNLPMAQPVQPVPPAAQAPMMPVQPIAQPLPESPLHTEVPVIQAAPVMQAPVQPQLEIAPSIPRPVPQPLPQPLSAPVAVSAPAPSLVPNAEQDDFEAVMNSLLRDFEDKPSQSPGFAAEAANGGGRERIEPDLSGVTSLADLCDRSNAANSEDYLLLSAYYLSRMERQDTFSLKKVNSVLVKSGLTPVNHSVLETVLTNGYLSMVPDLTGMAEVTEYQISQEGIEAAIALL